MSLKYVPVFLIALSLSATLNLGLAGWPGHWHMPGIAKDFSAQPAYAASEKATLEKLPEQKLKTIQPAKLATSEHAKEQTDETGLVGTAEASIFPGNPADDLSQEEIEVLSGLRDIKKKLDARSKILDERQQSIEKDEVGISKRVGELESLLAKINDRIQQEASIKNKKIKRLAAVYASMKPKKSALVLSGMELPIVVKMFTRMDEKKVGKILSFLPPEKAVKITQALTQPISALNK